MFIMDSFKEVIALFDFSFEKLINETMLELSTDIIELNQVEQLQEGIDALGQKIISISAEAFILFTNEKLKGYKLIMST